MGDGQPALGGLAQVGADLLERLALGVAAGQGRDGGGVAAGLGLGPDDRGQDDFRAASDLLPELKAERELAVRLLVAVGDCYFYLRDWEACHEAMQEALRCGADVANPFLRLRLGQSLYELGNEREAANWLVPVYLTEGRGLFSKDDPKYLEFFRGKLAPPPGGWPEGW